MCSLLQKALSKEKNDFGYDLENYLKSLNLSVDLDFQIIQMNDFDFKITHI